MWETICDAQAGFCTHSSNSKFLSKFSRKPLSGISDQKAHPPMKNFRFEMTKVYSGIPPQMKTSDLRWPKFTLEYPPNEKLQIWDDQSLLQNTAPNENFRFEMTKVYSRIPPSPQMKTSDLRWPKFTLEYPPPMKNFRFEMTKVYSRIPPQIKTSDLRWPKFTPEYPPPWKLQIWDDQSLLWNTPLPPNENFRFEMTKVYSGILPNTPPPNKKLQIWDDQSLLPNTHQMKTSDLRWPKFTLEYPPSNEKLQIWDDQSLLQNTPLPSNENFRFEMTKVYSRIPLPEMKTSDLRWPKFTPEYPPPPKWKLQIWDDQSLLQNIPPNENFRFEMTKVYSRIPPSMKTSDLRWPKFTPEYPPPWKTSDLRWPKFTLEYPPPPKWKLQIWDDQSLLRNTPPNEKLQIWDDQSLLWNTPPQMKNFRFEMTKVYSGIPPLNENFRFEMTKVYSRISPQMKTSDLRWPKFTPEYPPPRLAIQALLKIQIRPSVSQQCQPFKIIPKFS